jgi:hypothetical protein
MNLSGKAAPANLLLFRSTHASLFRSQIYKIVADAVTPIAQEGI